MEQNRSTPGNVATGEGMCDECINGQHHGWGSQRAIAKGKPGAGELCRCLCTTYPPKQKKAKPAEQGRIEGPMLHITVKS